MIVKATVDRPISFTSKLHILKTGQDMVDKTRYSEHITLISHLPSGFQWSERCTLYPEAMRPGNEKPAIFIHPSSFLIDSVLPKQSARRAWLFFSRIVCAAHTIWLKKPRALGVVVQREQNRHWWTIFPLLSFHFPNLPALFTLRDRRRLRLFALVLPRKTPRGPATPCPLNPQKFPSFCCTLSHDLWLRHRCNHSEGWVSLWKTRSFRWYWVKCRLLIVYKYYFQLVEVMMTINHNSLTRL